jgi:hypothetical protein
MRRNYAEFTTAQLKTIKKNDGKITLKALAELLEMNYSNLSGALSFYKVSFTPIKPKRRERFVEKSKMDKTHNEKGEELLTDEMMLTYSYANNSN